jgi:transporter family protein
MNWQFLVLISIAAISIANLYQRLAMKENDSDPIASSIVFQFSLALITGIYGLSGGFHLPSLSQIPFFIISMLFYGFGTLSYFKAIKLIEASESTILASIGSITTVISAYFFLGERLNNQQLVGVFFVLLSVIVLSANRKMKFNKGISYSILGTIFYGLAVTNDAYILRSYDALSYTPIMSLLPGLMLFVLYPKSSKSVVQAFLKPTIKPLLLYSFFYGIQAVTYYAALEKGALASQMALIYKSEIFITVILAAIFLHETDNLPKKFLSTVMASIGVYLLI